MRSEYRGVGKGYIHNGLVKSNISVELFTSQRLMIAQAFADMQGKLAVYPYSTAEWTPWYNVQWRDGRYVTNYKTEWMTETYTTN